MQKLKGIRFALVAMTAAAMSSVRAVGERLHDGLFNHMARAGLILGAEVLTATRTQVAITLGQKTRSSAHNKVRTVFVDTPGTWSAVNGDTAGTGIILPKGSRLLSGPTVSSAAGTASSTMSIGLRNPVTKVAIDATAIVSAVSIASSAVAQINTGTKLTAGQYYELLEDAEIYLTFGGANPTANQAIRAEIGYVAP